MIVVTGKSTYGAPVGEMSEVDALTHLVKEITAIDKVSPGEWELGIWCLPSSTVRCVQLRLPARQAPELTYSGADQDWERDLFVFELYAHSLLRVACPDRSGLQRAYSALSCPADFAGTLLLSMAASKLGQQIPRADLNGMTIQKLAAYLVALYLHEMNISEAHIFAAKYN